MGWTRDAAWMTGSVFRVWLFRQTMLLLDFVDWCFGFLDNVLDTRSQPKVEQD